MNLTSRINLYLNIARLFARHSRCKRLQVGCVITKEHRIVSSGYNGPLPNEQDCSLIEDVELIGATPVEYCSRQKSCLRAVHAEANAIYAAAKLGISLQGSILYCTHSPCNDCVEAIIQSGIKEVYYIEEFRESSMGRLYTHAVKVTQWTPEEHED